MYSLNTQKKHKRKLDEIGFVTYNLCLNARTAQKHTECDASYTVITIPYQVSTKFTDGKKTKDDLSSISMKNVFSLSHWKLVHL